MLYGEIIAVSSEVYTKHTNTLCGQNVQLLECKTGGTYRNHLGFGGLNICYKNQSGNAV
jgi:hypothetical protein